MAIETIQSCDNCQEKRAIGQRESPEKGGWRTIEHNADKVELCPLCVEAVVRLIIQNPKVPRVQATPV